MKENRNRIGSKQDLKNWLSYERKKYIFNKFNFFCEQRIAYRYNRILRKTEYYVNTNKKILKKIYAIKLSLIQNKHQIRIPINTVAKGLKIMHIGPILINSNSKIGKDCSIHINTALVAKGVETGAPILGDGVIVGVGAVVLGNVHVANNIAIGANSVVTKDFLEEDIAIAGVPAKKVSSNGRTKWYIRRK